MTRRRNIFETTLALSGIAFLTEPREISPLISRLRWQTSDHFDVEWDFDLDTGAKKFTSNNVLINFHEGNIFSGLSYARLNAPGRFNVAGFSSAVSDFTPAEGPAWLRRADKAGLGVAANAGVDLNRGPRCSMARCRCSTTGTAAGSAWSTGSMSWVRCATRMPTGSTSLWRISGRRVICAGRKGFSRDRTLTRHPPNWGWNHA